MYSVASLYIMDTKEVALLYRGVLYVEVILYRRNVIGTLGAVR